MSDFTTSNRLDISFAGKNLGHIQQNHRNQLWFAYPGNTSIARMNGHESPVQAIVDLVLDARRAQRFAIRSLEDQIPYIQKQLVKERELLARLDALTADDIQCLVPGSEVV